MQAEGAPSFGVYLEGVTIFNPSPALQQKIQ